MGTYVNANTIRPDTLSSTKKLWLYNGLDVLLTSEIYEPLKLKVDKFSKNIYEFQRGMMAPAIKLMRRGLRVDHAAIETLKKEYIPLMYRMSGMARDAKGKWFIKDKTAIIQQIAYAIWDKPLNINSSTQLKKIFYDSLQIPEHYEYKKGVRTVSCSRQILEHIAKMFPRAATLALCIIYMRDMEKTMSVLETTLGKDGRLRCSYNICGTETGRWSSSSSAFWDGTNLQNITKDLRSIIIPDEGMTMFYADLKSAESYAVGYLSGDEAYIKACSEGDIHTAVAKLIWPNAGWTGDIEEDKERAGKLLIYRDKSARFMCKKAGHGTNYLGKARTIAQQINTQEWIVKVFQAQYYGGELMVNDLYRWGLKSMVEENEVFGKVDKFIKLKGAFPGIREWQDRVISEIETSGLLVTPFDRRRQFWGRPYDPATHREGVAFLPQSTVGDLLNWGLFNLNTLENSGVPTYILAQGHDAVLGQVPTGLEKEMEPIILNALMNPVEINGRTMLIPADIKWGRNWKEVS